MEGGREIFDPDLFRHFYSFSLSTMANVHSGIKVLSPTRCYSGLSAGLDDLGGFHGRFAVGYRYIPNVSISETLNPSMVQSREVRTVEALRCIIHDSIHASTYRRIRRVPRNIQTDASVYREQYGFNFRKANGLSYSSPELTKRSPEAINLNLLMDGLTVIMTERVMVQLIGDRRIKSVTVLEGELLKEITGQPFDESVFPQALSFHQSVVVSSVRFVERWGGETFTRNALGAMISGDLGEIKAYFAEQYGQPDAWEYVFKRPEYKNGGEGV